MRACAPEQSAGERFNTAGKGWSRLRSERSLQETCVKYRPGIGQFKVHLDTEEVFKLFTRQHGLAALARTGSAVIGHQEAALTGLRRTEFSEQNLRRAGVRNCVVDENHTDIGVLQNFCAPRRAMRRDIPNRNRKEFAKRTAQLKEELRINRRFRTGALSKERQALLFTVGEHRAGNEAIVDFSGRKNAGQAVVGLKTEEQREVTFAAIEINEERRIFSNLRNPAPQKRRYGTRTRSASSTRHRNGLSDPHA